MSTEDSNKMEISQPDLPLIHEGTMPTPLKVYNEGTSRNSGRTIATESVTKNDDVSTLNSNDEASLLLRQMAETQNALVQRLQAHSNESLGGNSSQGSRLSHMSSVSGRGMHSTAMSTLSADALASDDQLKQLSMQNLVLMNHIKAMQSQKIPNMALSGMGDDDDSYHSNRSNPKRLSGSGSFHNSSFAPQPSGGFAMPPPPPMPEAVSISSARSTINSFPAPQGLGVPMPPRRATSYMGGMPPALGVAIMAPRDDPLDRSGHSARSGGAQSPFRADVSVRSSLSARSGGRSVGHSSILVGPRPAVSGNRSVSSRRSTGRNEYADVTPIHVPDNIVLTADNNDGFSNHGDDTFDDRSVLSGGSRGSGLSRQDRSAGTRPSRDRGTGNITVSTGHNSRVSQKKQYNDPIDPYVRDDEPPGSRLWKSFCVAATCCVPDSMVPREGEAPKLAWREKVAICIIVFFISLAIVGGIGFMPIFLCRPSDYYTQEDINLQTDEAWITVFGNIYDMKSYIGRHPGGSEGIKDYLGQDASPMFPRLPPANLPSFCLDLGKNSSYVDTIECPTLDYLDTLAGVPCHKSAVGQEAVHNLLKGYKKGNLVIAPWELTENGFGEDNAMQFIYIDDNVYDVTQYIDSLRDEITQVVDKEWSHENAYLSKELHELIVNKLNQDATKLYDDLFDTNDFKFCLDAAFFHAQVDRREDKLCSNIGIAMYLLLFIVTFMMLVQVLCSLLYLARRHPQFTDEDKKAAVMVMVPCYNETDRELLKTIDSVLVNEYPEENKVLAMVADGCVTGHGSAESTPEVIASILGFEYDPHDEAYEYACLGKETTNHVSVYAGVYEKKIGNGFKRLKYIVLVKQGSLKERGINGAGNRGKRDSQLLLTGMLNRLHYNRQPTELDNIVKNELDRLDIPMKDIEYMMAIDADTRVHETAMPHMVYSLERNPTVLACCGETQVDNKAQSWVTMIQVFEYFSSHHMKKAFESVFGCVTCLPGCFTMYRLFTEELNPLISSDAIFSEYSRNDIQSLHEKNLYELGEDRMLTTLLLQKFPGMKLSFVPEAICWTIVPHVFSVLVSQRRRWINSTLHNMFELLKVETMCGICCLSMKMIVIADLIATLILPASIAYLSYLTYLFITEPESIDQFVLYFYAVTVALMMLPFLIRSRWDYLFWFLVYIVMGIPVFYFMLPLYSFLHMDDFTWGKTRMVSTEGGPNGRDDDTEEESTQRKDDRSIRGGSVRGKTMKGDASHMSRQSTRSMNTGASGGTGRSSGRAVNAMCVGTDSGEILVYFRSPKYNKQPYLAPLVKALERSEQLRQEYNIDAILTRQDPIDPSVPLRSDPEDPDEDEVWFVIVRRLRSLRENSGEFRQQYTESLCELFQDLSGRHKSMVFAFRYGEDLTPDTGSAPLGDYITTVDTIAYMEDLNPTKPLDALVRERESIVLYFGERRYEEGRSAILQEMFERRQEQGADEHASFGSGPASRGWANPNNVNMDNRSFSGQSRGSRGGYL